MDGVVPDSPAAIEWDVELGGIASSEAVTAVEVTVRAREPFATLRWPEAISRLSEVEPGLFSIAGRREEPARFLRFEEKPGGLSVTDEGDGAVILDDGKLVPTFDPGLVNESLGLSMVGLDDSIVAVVLAEPSGPAIVSRSSDGRNWEELGPWDITEGATGGTFYIGGSNGELHAEYHGPGPRVRSRRRGTPPAASTGSRSSIRHRPIRTS